jgi:uncharacterized membrane protein
LKFRTLIIVGLAIRLAIAPFFAHPYDVFSWYIAGESLLRGQQPVWNYLIPYYYSFFLFAFPATAAYNFLSHFIPNYTIQMSSLNPLLDPAEPSGITVVPGLLFNFLVKLPFILSDTIIAVLIYKLCVKHFGSEREAVIASSIWFLNPLTVWISAAWGTFDTIPAMFTVLTLYCVLEKKYYVAGITLVAAIATKYYAAVLLFPLLIVCWRVGGKIGIKKLCAAVILASTLLFLPLLNNVARGFTYYVAGSSVEALHTSGLSIWGAITLYFSEFNETFYSSLSTIIAILIIYAWTWKRRYDQSFMNSLLTFTLPLTCVLLLYRSISENFFDWILPFLSMIALRERLTNKLFWVISATVFLASITDSLLPYYMLPTAPWTQEYLLQMLKLVAPYRIAPTGVIVTGFSVGKLILSSYSIISSLILIVIILNSVARKSYTKMGKIRH